MTGSLFASSSIMSLEVEGGVDVTLSLEELVLELNPMESDGMETTLHDIHHHEYSHSNTPEGEPQNEGSENCLPEGVGTITSGLPCYRESLLNEHSTQLRMGKRKSPKSEVRGGVRHRSENKLNCLDHLMDEQSSERVVMLVLDASLSIEECLVVSNIIFILSFLVSSINELVDFIGTGLCSSFDVVEVFVLVMVGRAAEGIGTRLDTKHERNTQGNKYKHNDSNALLCTKEVDTVFVSIDNRIREALACLTSEGH